MQDELLWDLFISIKKDDIKAFDKHMAEPHAKEIAFGRFPLLSLCYLYDANKIISKYENELIKINNYIRFEENDEMYSKFKAISHRVLRLYVGENKMVSPLEMLCILGRASRLEKIYNAAPKSALIIENIKMIEQIKTSRAVDVGETRIVMPRQPMNKKTKRALMIACAASILMIFICVGVIFGVSNFGIGTDSKPYVVYNAQQLQKAIQTNANVVLGSNIDINAISLDEFSGSLNGNGYTLTLLNQQEPICKDLTGVIKNISIKANLNISVDQDFALLTKNNKGTISDVEVQVLGEITYIGTATTTSTYISAVSKENEGSIVNTKVNLDLIVNGNKTSEILFGGLTGNNNGDINNVEVSGKLVLNHVNGASIACENQKSITNAKSALDITQTSDVNNVNLIIGGIANVNAADISNCEYSGNILIENKNELGVYVFAAGINVLNYANIDKCKFSGTIKVDTTYSGNRIGGIVTEMAILQNELPRITNCGVSGDIDINYENTNSFTYAGGILGYTQSSCNVDNCFFIGTIKLPKEGQLMLVGGLVGLWNGYNTIQNNAYYVGENNLHGIYYLRSYFIGYEALDNVEGLFMGYSSIDDIKALEIYWE